ncbi:MAG: arsenate reductase ArsC [Pseudomonadota bacterium]|nr:arsenate reductase ArsC [Pseudomonadota bacterium]MDE3038264.1 arsenate reductase ArsC [Pseudomonadota bacterium]
MKKVLFLCTGNSCRSIMAEALLNHLGKDQFIAFSAGSFPTGTLHPFSVRTLLSKGVPGSGLRSKHWDEFKGKPIDIVITVCDQSAAESCPLFPGKPIRGHWSLPDPAKYAGSESERLAEFQHVYDLLEYRIKAFLRLPLDQMLPTEITGKLNEIGRLEPQAA